MTPEPIAPSKLAAADAFRAAGIGLRTRRLRSILSALGIMIGIGAMVAVLGLSESSKSDLIAQLDRLGTNMLQVQAGTGIGLGPGELPDTAPAMVTRIDPVETVAAIADIDSARVYKNDLVPEGQTGGLSVLAAETNLLQTLQGSMADGFFLDEATPDYPVTVLGSVAAERLGIRNLDTPTAVWLGDEWFSVVGIMESLELSPNLDRAALVSFGAAETYLAGASGAQAGGGQATEAAVGPRLVVFASTEMFDWEPSRLYQNRANRDLLLNSVSWMLGVSENIGIGSREDRTGRISVDPKTGRMIGIGAIVAAPLLVAVIGLGVWYLRKQ
ncbi:MAG: ABC transporter permease [Acidobacteria bacterium]|nr:ABC transporter permease [Acidobacteriota bacterium]